VTVLRQKELNEAFNHMLSSLDIRLRNKLTVLLPALDLLEKRIAPDGEADAAVLRYLGEARRAAFSILRLAKNLGDQAKYAVDYDMSEPVLTDVAALFVRLTDETRKMAVYKDVGVTLAYSESPFFAFIDPAMTERLLYNLLSNAILHGEGDVSVELLREEGFILFRVRNAGGAISDMYEGEERAFGTGLSVASAIVLQSGGTMMVTTGEKEGTVVTVSLPDLPGGDEGEFGLPEDPCAFPPHLVELSDFPAYHPEYNTQRREEGPCITSMP
jgi:signal transduction histidine kinase